MSLNDSAPLQPFKSRGTQRVPASPPCIQLNCARLLDGLARVLEEVPLGAPCRVRPLSFLAVASAPSPYHPPRLTAALMRVAAAAAHSTAAELLALLSAMSAPQHVAPEYLAFACHWLLHECADVRAVARRLCRRIRRHHTAAPSLERGLRENTLVDDMAAALEGDRAVDALRAWAALVHALGPPLLRPTPLLPPLLGIMERAMADGRVPVVVAAHRAWCALIDVSMPCLRRQRPEREANIQQWVQALARPLEAWPPVEADETAEEAMRPVREAMLRTLSHASACMALYTDASLEQLCAQWLNTANEVMRAAWPWMLAAIIRGVFRHRRMRRDRRPYRPSGAERMEGDASSSPDPEHGSSADDRDPLVSSDDDDDGGEEGTYGSDRAVHSPAGAASPGQACLSLPRHRADRLALTQRLLPPLRHPLPPELLGALTQAAWLHAEHERPPDPTRCRLWQMVLEAYAARASHSSLSEAVTMAREIYHGARRARSLTSLASTFFAVSATTGSAVPETVEDAVTGVRYAVVPVLALARPLIRRLSVDGEEDEEAVALCAALAETLPDPNAMLALIDPGGRVPMTLVHRVAAEVLRRAAHSHHTVPPMDTCQARVLTADGTRALQDSTVIRASHRTHLPAYIGHWRAVVSIERAAALLPWCCPQAPATASLIQWLWRGGAEAAVNAWRQRCCSPAVWARLQRHCPHRPSSILKARREPGTRSGASVRFAVDV
ncbi:hypothetical protein CDCA_CDCA04G1235 [Cyanidium caldarium]|uniref:Uncharacterized protein n=1 Tax=Cyanidium caldarium TaxID=2771 RepID=A0AAV9ISZ1_CYACA|nr:hypothetical protein CDCA_CDCA04G1235 [Cyanidium caldarium]